MSTPAGTSAVRGGSGFSAYKRLLGYIRPYRGQFVLGLLGAIAFAATMAGFALFMRSFGDGTFVHRDPRTIVWVPLGLVGLFFLRGLGDFTQTYFMGYVGRRIVSQIAPVGGVSRSLGCAERAKHL